MATIPGEMRKKGEIYAKISFVLLVFWYLLFVVAMGHLHLGLVLSIYLGVIITRGMTVLSTDKEIKKQNLYFSLFSALAWILTLPISLLFENFPSWIKDKEILLQVFNQPTMGEGGDHLLFVSGFVYFLLVYIAELCLILKRMNKKSV